MSKDQGQTERLPATSSELAAGVTPAAARQALDWLMSMQSGTFSGSQHQAWQRWRAADPTHESAWRQIERVNQRLQQVSSTPAAMRAFEASGQARRRHLKLLGGAFGIAAFALGGREAIDWRFGGDYVSAIGQVRAETLSDGTQLYLNTDSALDIVSEDSAGLTVRLRRGEVMLVMPPDSMHPIRLETEYGQVQAWRARFMARRLPQTYELGVFSGNVEVTPVFGAESQGRISLSSGQEWQLSRSGVAAGRGLPAFAGDWAEGMLIVVDMPLSQVLDELSRYRVGVVRCAPEIAGWKVSGSYPLNDTDRALQALAETLHLNMTWRTRYWVSLHPRSQG